jgi:hypothetical protein
MPSFPRLARAVLLVLVAAFAVSPAVASAGEGQLSIMMDDDLLLYRGDHVRDQTMKTMKNAGVDAVRVTVLWNVVAENARDGEATKAQKKRFASLGAANPKADPKTNWDRFDNLVRACATLRMTCYFNVTGPGPAWAHAKPPAQYRKDAKWWKPKAREYYKFVQALGKRYNGRFRDENTPNTLPRVTLWSLWNEPNQGGWLRPQWLNGKAVSPSLYRELHLFAYRALVSTGHGGDYILAAETAPINVTRKTTTSAMGPKIFNNELLCGPGSNGLGCSIFKKEGPILATAWAHHPYTKKLSPLQRDSDPQAITLANFGDLGTQLDQLAATGNVRAGMPLISTEFGYETNPPDPFAATSLEQQAQFDQLGDLITYLNPRVVGNTQFLLRDVKPDKTKKKDSKQYWATYQSGLQTSGGTDKPAAVAYRMPFLANVASRNELGQPVVNIFGQLRFLPNTLSAAAPGTVHLQYLPTGAPATAWTDFGEPVTVTSAVGYYNAAATVPGAGQVRAQWRAPLGGLAVSSLPQPVS